MKLTAYERLKEWRKNHPSKAKAAWQRYYQKHAESIKATKRSNYQLKVKTKNERNEEEVQNPSQGD